MTTSQISTPGLFDPHLLLPGSIPPFPAPRDHEASTTTPGPLAEPAPGPFARRSVRHLRGASVGATGLAPLSGPGTALALSAVLVLLAALVAPERPRDQEAICQRHNGVAACRVW